MVKKIAALAGAGAILLGVAVPVLAKPHKHHGGSSDVAMVTNSASAVADTGDNVQTNYVDANDDVKGNANVSGNHSMTTGAADAYAGALVVANTHVGCCDEPSCDQPCGKPGKKGEDHTDFANVTNSAGAQAYTGVNYQGNDVTAGDDVGSKCGGGNTNVSGSHTMKTGAANADSHAWTIVNTHLDK